MLQWLWQVAMGGSLRTTESSLRAVASLIRFASLKTATSSAPEAVSRARYVAMNGVGCVRRWDVGCGWMSGDEVGMRCGWMDR